MYTEIYTLYITGF